MVTQLPDIKQDTIGSYAYFGGFLNDQQVQLAIEKIEEAQDVEIGVMRMNKTTRDGLFTPAFEKFTQVPGISDQLPGYELYDDAFVIDIDSTMRDLYIRFS